jgi:phosphatidylserine decarboxylase
MASSFNQHPVARPPTQGEQSAALNSLTKLIRESKAGERAPHESVVNSGISDHFRNLVSGLASWNSVESFENAWHLGNYVIDRQTGQKSFEPMSIYVRLGMHFLYYGYGQEAILHLKQTRDILEYQSKQMGAAYDSAESKAHIEPFINAFHLRDGLRELIEPDPTKYATFNQFFAREINPLARPIAEPDDRSVVSSPADCRLTVFPTVDQATKYWIKGHGFTIGKLLDDEVLAATLAGGTIAIARLAPQDYHRWHSPVDGSVHTIKEIPGTYYTVNPQAINQPGIVDVFCENRRSVMVISRKPNNAPIIVVAVGAMLVGSIKYNPGIVSGADIKRGQCLGAFQYGGSTVIVLCPRGEMVPDQDLVENSTQQNCETLVKVGWRIGKGKD